MSAEQRAQNIRFGSVMATILNAAPFRGKSRKVWKWTDFFKDVEAPKAITAAAARAHMLSLGSQMQAFEARRAKTKNPSRSDEAE